jgi:SpoVK/Ycf46/Vps4 family AAA+-type ATPase
LTRHNALRPQTIWEIKAGTLKKHGLLTLHRGNETLDDLGGLQALKTFCLRALGPRKPDSTVKPRGLLLLSPPGCGKSQFCKALGNAVGRPTLILDVGALLGSLVGQSESNLRQALRTIDAMAPAICMVDELEKALSGVGSNRDSGVSTRIFGTLLTYLSDHESDVFFVATSNDISKLPPELARAERFDGVFFLDLPSPGERDQIWLLYRRQFGIPESQARPDDSNWTGAEIRSCCRLAALLDVPLTQAALNVVPVAVTASESVEKLRSWASGRCLSASSPGIYRRDGEPAVRPGRRMQRGGPSSN